MSAIWQNARVSCLWPWNDFRSVFHAEIISAFCVFINNDVPSSLSPRVWVVASIFVHVFFTEHSCSGIHVPVESLLKSLLPLARLSVRPSAGRELLNGLMSLRIGEMLSLCSFNFYRKSLTARLTIYKDVHSLCSSRLQIVKYRDVIL